MKGKITIQGETEFSQNCVFVHENPVVLFNDDIIPSGTGRRDRELAAVRV